MISVGSISMDLILVLLASVLLALSFPAHDLGFLAWVGLVPLLLAVSVRKILCGAALCFLCGLVFFPIVFSWILEISGYTLVHHGLLDLYLSSYFALFGLAFGFIRTRLNLPAALAASPFLWVAIEYARSNMSFLALPWVHLSHSQYLYPTMLQAASVGGAYMVSFLIVAVNAGITAALLRIREPGAISLAHARTIVAAAAGLFTASALFGAVSLQVPVRGPEVRVAAVQGNIEQAKKMDRAFAKEIVDTYAGLTREAARLRTHLTVWPETATPRAINMDGRLAYSLQELSRETEAYLLVGSSQTRKHAKDAGHLQYRNSAFLISPVRNRFRQQYDKIRLLPFGEYLPFSESIPWSWLGIPDMQGYDAGNEIRLLEMHGVKIGTPICWESIFPDQFRQFVGMGAQFIVNITNEAWFGKTAAPRQFLSMNVMRAVENRVYVVRCANTGISCVIDPHGRVLDRVRDPFGNEIFVTGYLTHTIVASTEGGTLYTRLGDWVAWMSIVVSGLVLICAALKERIFPPSPAGR